MGRFANSDTRDPAVNVTNWFLIVVVVLSVLIRLGTKYWIFHKLTSDDYLIIASLAFCIAQSAAISTAVSHGYGYHFATISSQNFEQVMKSQYAAYILYIASLCLSKLSLSTFIRSLTPVHKDHFQAAVLQGLIAVLGVVGVLGTAFQCHLPRPWDYWHGRCFNLAAWNYFLCVSNIVTDCLIIAQALLLIAGIQATWKKKAVFASIFRYMQRDHSDNYRDRLLPRRTPFHRSYIRLLPHYDCVAGCTMCEYRYCVLGPTEAFPQSAQVQWSAHSRGAISIFDWEGAIVAVVRTIRDKP